MPRTNELPHSVRRAMALNDAGVAADPLRDLREAQGHDAAHELAMPDWVAIAVETCVAPIRAELASLTERVNGLAARESL